MDNYQCDSPIFHDYTKLIEDLAFDLCLLQGNHLLFLGKEDGRSPEGGLLPKMGIG
jgi:hypothetical protein